MNIIFEGPDNVGKGTQITNVFKYLANKTRRQPIWMHSANFGIKDEVQAYNYSMDWYEEMFEISANLWYSGKTVLHDRLHGGEWVYGFMYRGYQARYIYDIEKRFAESHPQVFQDTYLIVFHDFPQNLLDREDGLSFTAGLPFRERDRMKKQEIARFVDLHIEF